VPRSRIIGTGSYVPEKIVTNQDLEKIVETSDAWITERTGIKQRHFAAEGETTSDMALHASRKALRMAGAGPEDIDLIVVGTVTPDMPMPSCATFLQGKLGATHAAAFDISAACAGSLFALSIADRFIATGMAKKALVVGAELLTRVVDWKDRTTCVLFGDAAGAMVIAPTPKDEHHRGILSTHIHTDGRLTDILVIPPGGKVKMNGREVYKVAVRSLEETTREALAANELTVDDITHVIAHQANLRIIEAVMKRLAVPMEKCWLNIDKYGNTSSASAPMTLDEANRAGRLKPGDIIAMMAIGAGMAWGSAIIRW
jgi:3-oxoacyl-[acyl-carrier-protein] synthase-3